MFSEMIQRLSEWIEKDVSVVADILDLKGNKTSVRYNGILVEAAHLPANNTAIFSIDELVIRTNDMIYGLMHLPTKYIERIEMLPTKINITKTNGYKVTITLKDKVERPCNYQYSML